MATLEQEVLEKFSQLDPAAKLRVKSAIVREVETNIHPSEEREVAQRLGEIESIRQQIRKDNNGEWPIQSGDALAILRQIREGDDECW